MKYQTFMSCLVGVLASSSLAVTAPVVSATHHQGLFKQPGFFRFSFDNVNMPYDIQNMGLLGVHYFSEVTPNIYGGIGGYGAVSGNQGGLFILGFTGGLHHQFTQHWWGDTGLFVGGGGGRSSLVGGGLMLRPYAGIAYDWRGTRLGVHYSYVDFPSGLIHSQQIGLDVDVPWDFYYTSSQGIGDCFNLSEIFTPCAKFITVQRNDFSLFLQAYRQRPGTKNVIGQTQDGTIGLVGAELDHYFTDQVFGWARASGAFRGIPNGYMDVLAGLGYHGSLMPCGVALVPQVGVGAGGGGNVDTGGGILINPSLGLEVPFSNSLAARVSGGYLWAPKGTLNAVTANGSLIYHLDVASASAKPSCYLPIWYKRQGWRMQLLNQTYFNPARAYPSISGSINMVAFQVDQLFTPTFFLSYQAASAYSGDHAGGFATGMIGPGLQTPAFCQQRVQLFTEVLIGAGGGGALAMGGGSLIEPVIGMHVALTPTLGLQTSFSQIKALRDQLNTSVLNVGMTVRFGTLLGQ